MPNRDEKPKKLVVYIVDDDREDVDLLLRGFKEAQVDCELRHLSNGEELLAKLEAADGNPSLAKPDLILLDLNMPVLNGRETLARLKGDDRFTKIPVVVLSSSSAGEDVDETYRLGANSFVSKPDSLHDFTSTVQALKNYWLSLVRLPQP